MSLLEGIAAIGILALSGFAALGATIAGSHVVLTPAARDAVLIAAGNAAVEARAAAAYDAGAAAAILTAPPAAWTTNGITLQTSTTDQTLFVVAAEGTERASIASPIVREALPQGAVVDTSGNLIAP